MSDDRLKQDLIDLTTELYNRGVISAGGGNVSVRSLELENALWITPSSLFKGALSCDDLVLVDLEGKTLSGRNKPSIEVGFHTGLMKARKEINAVVHSHPPYAIVWGLGALPIPPITYDALILSTYPFIPWYMVGSMELATAIVDALGSTSLSGAFLRNHGLVTVGSKLRVAADATLQVEHTLKILHLARQMGIEPTELDPQSIQRLNKMAVERSCG